MLFLQSVGNDEASERPERDRSRKCQRIKLSAIPSRSIENKHHSCDAPDISAKETQEEDTGEKPFEEERDLVAENYDLKQKLFLSKFGLERFGSNEDDIFFTRDFRVTESPALLAFWNFIKPCSESLMSWNTARGKVKESFTNNVNPFPFLQGQEKQRNRKREIEPIDQLWLFLTRVRLGLMEGDLAHRFSVSVSTVYDVLLLGQTTFT